jgi:putative addiction module CopG family antidote
MESGLYGSASEVIREALRLFEAYQSVQPLSLTALKADIELGMVDVKEGTFVAMDMHATKAQGRVLKKVMAKPDALKMKYREALIQAVQEVVIGQLKPEKELVEKVASKMVNGKDLAAFTSMLEQALSQLHEGNIARYRLRRMQYLSWATVAHTDDS